MHWYCCNDAVRLLNKAKGRLFQSIMNFENLEICLNFVCQPTGQPAYNVRPGCVRCMAPEIQLFNTAKVIPFDLRNCCSDDNLPTALW